MLWDVIKACYQHDASWSYIQLPHISLVLAKGLEAAGQWSGPEVLEREWV
jgi:hypothetical protein